MLNEAQIAKLEKIGALVGAEITDALASHPSFNSAHEGWAVLREEVDELWDEVKKRPSARDVEAMKVEAIQVAAMAIRFVLDCT